MITQKLETNYNNYYNIKCYVTIIHNIRVVLTSFVHKLQEYTYAALLLFEYSRLLNTRKTIVTHTLCDEFPIIGNTVYTPTQNIYSSNNNMYYW